MRRVTSMVIAAAVVLWATTAFAQAKPGDFTGKWTREAGAAPAGGGGGAAGGGGGGQRGAGGGGGRGGGGGGAVNCGMTCDIVASATSLKVTRAGQNGAADVVWTCTTDGKDCTNEQPGRGGAAGTPVVSQTKWEAGKFTVTTKRDMNGTSVTSTQTLSIEGGKLMISSTSSMSPAGTAPQVATYTKG